MLNHIGIIHCNKDRFSVGLPFLSKAKQLYEIGKKIKSHSGEINNILRNFLRGSKTNNKVSAATEEFWFYIDGGLDTIHLERNYTQTVFYLAQVYSSLKENTKAIHYCIDTMKW